MKLIRYIISILSILSLFSCEREVPYPHLAKKDVLLRVWCDVDNSDSALVSVSRLYAITHDHRDQNEYMKDLNSELSFFVNGKEVPFEIPAQTKVSDEYNDVVNQYTGEWYQAGYNGGLNRKLIIIFM